MMCTRAAMVRSFARWTTSGTSRSTQGVPRGVPTRTQLCTTTRGSTSTPLPGFSATTMMGKAMRHRGGRRPLCVSVHASAEGVYDDPRTYELAFGFREFEKEARFMSALSERMGTGRPMTSLLELGAGPAWHSTATATALPGAVAVAVDNAAPMLARARERVADAALTDRVAVVEGDMTSLDATAVIEEATKMNKGEFFFNFCVGNCSDGVFTLQTPPEALTSHASSWAPPRTSRTPTTPSGASAV